MDGILLSFKKMNPICSNMNGPRYYHTKWSKSDRQKADTIWYHLYVESKKMIQPNFFRNRFTDTENKLKLTKGDRWGGCDKLGGWD